MPDEFLPAQKFIRYDVNRKLDNLADYRLFTLYRISFLLEHIRRRLGRPYRPKAELRIYNDILSLCSLSVMIEVNVLLQIPSL